jgi:hypothetical protein
MSKKPLPASTTLFKDKFFDITRSKKLESAFDNYDYLTNFKHFS